jgi:hypothetical protein
MVHAIDTSDDWPPAELIEYLRAAPAGGPPVSVLPRPRPHTGAPNGLAYVHWDGRLVELLAARGEVLGYGGRTERDLPELMEFSAAEIAEFALAVLSNATWDAIKPVIDSAVMLLHRQVQPAMDRGETVQCSLRIARVTVASPGKTVSVEGIVATAPTPEGVAEQAERALRATIDGPDSAG